MLILSTIVQHIYEPNFCYNSDTSSFDQYQPPQLPDNHQFPQETSKEILQARDDLMEAIQAFLKEYDHIPPNEKCMALLLAEERFLKIKQAVEEEQNQPGVMQELLLKLMDDLQILKGIQQEKEKPTAQSFTPYGNFSMIDDVEILPLLMALKRSSEDLSDSNGWLIEPDQGELTNIVIEEVDTFLVSEDSISPGIESDFDPGGGEINVSQNVEDEDSFTFGYLEGGQNKVQTDKTRQNEAEIRERDERENMSQQCLWILLVNNLGEVRLPIKELMEGIKDEGNDMQFVSYQVKQDSKKPVGSLKFSYQFRKKSKKQAPVNPQLDQRSWYPPKQLFLV
ncbi:hypothetical protein Tco_1359379 [Tanacetum coccineum]